MAGQEVSRNDLDYKMANTLVNARNVVRDLETINAFLQNTPVNAEGVDPLTVSPADGGKFGYTEDEVYLIRNTFQQLETMQPVLGPLLDTARGLTGLL